MKFCFTHLISLIIVPWFLLEFAQKILKKEKLPLKGHFTFKLGEIKICHFWATDNRNFELLPFDTPRKSWFMEHISWTSLFEFNYTELYK